MAQIIGSRTTAQMITEARNVRRIDDKIAMLEPNEGPLITLTNAMNKRRATDQVKYEHIEDDFVARWGQNSNALVTAGTTTITVVDGTLFVVGDLFLVPGAVTSSAKPEVCLVVGISTNVLTIVRDIGGVGTSYTIPANASLAIIGNAYEEGGALAVAKTTAPVTKFNYTQIFKTTVNLPKTYVAVNQYGAQGGERKRLQAKAMKEHRIKMNRAFLFGQKSNGTSTIGNLNPLRTTDGINSIVTTNVVDAGGVLDEVLIDSFAQMSFRYGQKTKLLLASPKICGAINSWAHGRQLVTTGAKKFGVAIQTLITPFGTWNIVNDWTLEDGVSGQNGFSGWAFSLDMEEIEYRFLSGNGENRDTHMETDVKKDGTDAYVDQILTEGGLQVRNEKYHAKLFNVQSYVN